MHCFNVILNGIYFIGICKQVNLWTLKIAIICVVVYVYHFLLYTVFLYILKQLHYNNLGWPHSKTLVTTRSPSLIAPTSHRRLINQKPLNRFSQNLIASKNLTPSTKFVFFGPNRPQIGLDFHWQIYFRLHLCNHWTQLMKLDREQVPNVLYYSYLVCVLVKSFITDDQWYLIKRTV